MADGPEGRQTIGANLQRADFAGALVENTVFDHANVTHASFSEVALAACSFQDAQGLSVSNSA